MILIHIDDPPPPHLFIRQLELLAELRLVLRPQVGVPLEGSLQAADLLRREGRAGPPPRRGGRRGGGGGGGRGGEGAPPLALVAGRLLLLLRPAAEAGFRPCREKRDDVTTSRVLGYFYCTTSTSTSTSAVLLSNTHFNVKGFLLELILKY